MEVRIKRLDDEIKAATRSRDELTRRINKLKAERETLQAEYNLKNSLKIDENWATTNFTWSAQAQELLEKKFNLKSFRYQQLSAINATLSRKDLLLLMPTGGGKTLCYQMPALLNNGMTLVISPLLALMEDQLITLRKLDIHAISMSSTTPKDIKTQGFQYMSKGVGKPIKLMYVTPEWLAKSKTFMSGLQKLHEAKKLDRIAIDEVHCCSQWGHDFRPDYKYLGLLKGMFDNVPIIGLTATATTNVLLDIQNMLDIPGCAIIRAPFDRPNLCFKVVSKPEKGEDCYEYLEKMLGNKFKDQSGIIYTATIKDSEEVTKALQARGLKVKNYHADLVEETRVKTHNKWLENKIQAVVATVAFGMGIDKPDVRFVIHYSVPKSMETLYQEGGRAGRDGRNAECIVMFKLADYLKNSGYTKSKTEVKNALSVLDYCMDLQKCRHYLIGLHFEDSEIKRCQTMCDNCLKRRRIEYYNATPACEDIYKIMDAAVASETNLTLTKLVDLWMKPKIKITKPNISKEQAENIIGNFILKQCIREEKNFTPYSVNCYLRKNSISGQCGNGVNIYLQNDGKIGKYLEKAACMKQDLCEISDDDSEESCNSAKRKRSN